METKILLSERDLPEQWYNIAPDLPSPLPPPLHPGTHQPIGPEALAPLFPMDLILQEVSQERYIPVPDEVRDVYKLWRPTPLIRAVRLERALETPAALSTLWRTLDRRGLSVKKNGPRRRATPP